MSEAVARVALRIPAVHPNETSQDHARRVERRIIQLLAHHAYTGKGPARLAALGLAEARSIILGEAASAALEYVSDMNARISSLSRRQQNKLRHPGLDRIAQQKILLGDA